MVLQPNLDSELLYSAVMSSASLLIPWFLNYNQVMKHSWYEKSFDPKNKTINYRKH